MMKISERNNAYSCWNRALDYELVFILLERDPAAPAAIRAWAKARVNLGCNNGADAQIFDAEHCASMMELDQARIRKEVADAGRSKAATGQGDTPMAQDGTREPRSR